jgi:excisionase family DNA binding protein
MTNDELKTTEELAERLRISTSTLRRWRSNGEGPKFIRVGKKVRYRQSDVEDWLSSQDAAVE